MNDIQKSAIERVLIDCLRKKFRTYKPETKHMPFHTRLLGKDRMALFSFIHSLNTVFGTSIFEPVAQQMGSASFQSASTHQKLDNKISAKAQEVIQNIIDQLNTASIRPNKPDEIKAIRSACRVGEMKSVKLTVVDLKLVSHSGDTYLIDIKSAKPNIGEFKGFKRTLLECRLLTMLHNTP